MYRQIFAAGIKSIQGREHFALVFNLYCLPNDCAARDVLDRPLHQTGRPPEFCLNPQYLAGVAFANLFTQFPMGISSKYNTCHCVIINELKTREFKGES